MTLLEYDNKLHEDYEIIVGLDEVGRGPLAGPVVAVAVILPKGVNIEGVTDSKKIAKKKHRELVDKIFETAIEVRVGVVDSGRIDQINILEADKEAMLIAVNQLQTKPDLLLIDGDDKQLLDTEIEQKTQVKGDSTSLSIAAASLVAKAVRDTMMDEYSKIYPGYGFETNSGYGTPKHMKAIEELGITPIHRLSFKPLKNNEDKYKWNYGL